MKERNCGTCAVWVKTNDDNGECHFGPPTPVMIGMQQGRSLVSAQPQASPVIIGVFPPTPRKAFCGCFQPKGAMPAVPAPDAAAADEYTT